MENDQTAGIIKILFVCHGNICRSPMAEFVMKNMVEKNGLSERVYVASAATSREEIGSPVHRGTQKMLEAHGIYNFRDKRAVRLSKEDYDFYDYIVGMDRYNIQNIMRLFGSDSAHKVHMLLDFTGANRDVDDPWYTGDFETTYADVEAGCQALLDLLISRLA